VAHGSGMPWPDHLRVARYVLMVRDVGRALAFYARLGFEEVFRDDDHAPRFPTRDVDALSEELAGVVDRTEVTDTSWGYT
jgi:catechol 2,3-dioxygenase-like lactoylglutathione lyase family enzyme